KWVYPASAADDEFMKRATLASTLIIDALDSPSLRQVLEPYKLHLGKDGRPLASRNLLQRAMLIAALIGEFRPDITTIAMLVAAAEGKTNVGESDLQAELARTYGRVRNEFAALAFLYDLRTHGGLAHPPNPRKASEAAVKLGLPDKN